MKKLTVVWAIPLGLLIAAKTEIPDQPIIETDGILIGYVTVDPQDVRPTSKKPDGTRGRAYEA